MREPRTFEEAIEYFSDESIALTHLIEARWAAGVACPRSGCGSRDVRAISRRRFRCGGCKRDFTAKLGTIFESSALANGKWLAAVWLLANGSGRVSSTELHRSLGVTQKTAWLMLRRLRVALRARAVEARV